MRLVAMLAIICLALSGCAAIPVALDAVLGGVGIYQRYEDRQEQRRQTEEIRKLRQAIEQRWPVLGP